MSTPEVSGPTSSDLASARRHAWLVAIVATILALSFAAYTQHAWEDYYITFRSSKNLVQGHGLVFTPGERVHTFTSPLGVLLPALSSALTGAQSDGAALWLFRIMSAAALGGATALVFLGLRRLRVGSAAPWIGAGLLGLEAKVLDFSTNGMETGFLLLFLAYAFWALCAAESAPWRHLGAAWAGIMWTRPDGFIYIGLLAGGFALFNRFGERRTRWREDFGLLLKAGLVCTLLYLPWFVWAWTYYGSPVPHTIIAKGSLNPDRTIVGFLQTFALMPLRLWTGQTTVEGALMPTYYQPAGWPLFCQYSSRIFGAIAMLAWLWPKFPTPVRAASLAFHGVHAYLTYFPFYPFPWYFPATEILGAIVCGGVLGVALGQGGDSRGLARLAGYASLALVGWMLLLETALTLASAGQMRAKQQLVYRGNLEQIGRWLKQNAKPNDYVFMEPLGYIGYFSGLRTHDFPGLSSPRMVEVRKGGNGWGRIILELGPEWIVLRDPEAARVNAETPDLLNRIYRRVRDFDVRPQVAATRVPDRFMLNFDAHFTLYRRAIPAATDDLVLNLYHPFGSEAPVTTIDDVRLRVVHAPGTMSVRVADGAKEAEIRYGFVPEAYTADPRTDGATFRVFWSDGPTTRELASRTLDPVNRSEDRGLQTFKLSLPASATGRARLLLNTRHGETMTKDWTCWSMPAYH